MCQFLNSELFSGYRNWEISSVVFHRSTKKYLPGQEGLDVLGRFIKRVDRRGKYLLFQLDAGILVCHNAMSGYWDLADRPWTFDYVEGKREATGKDVRIELRISPTGHDRPSERVLRFHDSRLFGSLRFYPDAKIWYDIPCLKGLGAEALMTKNSELWALDQFKPGEFFHIRDEKPDWEIKRVLMEQSVMTGVGNIYATEVLWEEGIHPSKPIRQLNDQQLESLRETLVFTLKNAIVRKCSYSDLCCYRQTTCCACNVEIAKTQVAGRSSYYCPSCQID